MGVQLSRFSHQIIFLFILPIISVVVVYAINKILQMHIPSPWIFIVDSLGILGMYTFLFQIFNYSLWQLIPSGIFQIVDVPNLNGTWVGELRSSFDKKTNPHEVRVEIIQTFSKIKICCYFQKSWSYSIVADFYEEADGRKVLHYVYKNEPRNNASASMHGHYGAAKHEYIKKRNVMECSYYNEPPRNRGWYGSFNVKRERKSIINSLFSSTKNSLS